MKAYEIAVAPFIGGSIASIGRHLSRDNLLPELFNSRREKHRPRRIKWPSHVLK